MLVHEERRELPTKKLSQKNALRKRYILGISVPGVFLGCLFIYRHRTARARQHFKTLYANTHKRQHSYLYIASFSRAMTAPAPLPLVCELRQASAGGCVARPVCLALGGRDPHCVLGFEDGAVAAWRTVRVPANGRDDAEIHHRGGGAAGGASGQLWMVTELAGSGGDTCPVDALVILSVGAVAVAHGGIQGKPIPRPPVVAVLCLATGRELRSLTLPMAWPDGGVCPVACLVAAGGEGGVAAVSAARIYRMGEGTQGFQAGDGGLERSRGGRGEMHLEFDYEARS